MLGKKGFTLIELLIVIIIVGILASVSVPMMRGNVKRARASEAVAALGAIRTQMRLVMAEHGTYNAADANVTVGGGVFNNVPGFAAGDLNGRYFSEADYNIEACTNTTFMANVTGSATGGTSNTNMSGVNITIDEDGNINESGF